MLLVLWGVPLTSVYYIWTPLAWLACWLRLERAPRVARPLQAQEIAA